MSIKGDVESLIELVQALKHGPNDLPSIRHHHGKRDFERLKDSDEAVKAAFIKDRIKELADKARALPDEELLIAIAGRPLVDD